MSCGTETQSYNICRCACKWRRQYLIPRIKKPGPPFGIGSKRDTHIGLHPKFYPSHTESPAVGSYDPMVPKCESNITNWKRELETEEFSKTMGGKLEKHATQRYLMKTGRGPGTHEIPEWPEIILDKACKIIKRDIGFGTVPLFEPAWPSTTPGPGYTRKCPYYYMDKRRREGHSSLPTFEYDGLQPRFRTVPKPWMLPCNLYDVKDSKSLKAFLQKFTGKKGPYDLFTGPRDESTIKGYFATVKLEDRGAWPTSLPGEMGKLLHKSNYYKGLWSTCQRFPKVSGSRMMLKNIALCYKDPKEPGPGHYNPRSLRKPKNMKNYPFDINVEFIWPGPSWRIEPGPGRYKIKDTRIIKGNGWTSVFKSKAPRTHFIVIPTYNAF